jgi:hypothetical protein
MMSYHFQDDIFLDKVQEAQESLIVAQNICYGAVGALVEHKYCKIAQISTDLRCTNSSKRSIGLTTRNGPTSHECY